MGKPTPILVALRRVAKTRNLSVAEVLQYYAMERFLYRIGISDYRQNFILKGAMLLRVWDNTSSRSTRDIDFLAFGRNDLDSMKKCLVEIVQSGTCEDGVCFDHNNFVLTPIKEQDEYQGIRVRFSAHIESASIPMQLDIGFGDAVRPQVLWENYPILLDHPEPRIRVYSKESVIAEKTHAMIKLDMINSRLKDYYDIWILTKNWPFERSAIVNSMIATFEARKTSVPSILNGLSIEYTLSHQSMWKNYLKKTGLKAEDLDIVIEQLRQFLLPCLDDARQKTSQSAIWDPQEVRWN